MFKAVVHQAQGGVDRFPARPRGNIFRILRRCDDDKKDQVYCLKDGTDGVVSTTSTTTSNPLPILYCYDISCSNEATPRPRCAKARMLKPFSNQTIDSAV